MFYTGFREAKDVEEVVRHQSRGDRGRTYWRVTRGSGWDISNFLLEGLCVSPREKADFGRLVESNMNLILDFHNGSEYESSNLRDQTVPVRTKNGQHLVDDGS